MRWLLLGFLLLPACDRTPRPAASPDAAYAQFVKLATEAHLGKPVPLMDAFDQKTRAALEARVAAATKATGDTMPAEPLYQLVVSLPQAAPPKGISIASQTEAEAHLLVDTGTAPPQPVTMVKELGAWKVHLDL